MARQLAGAEFYTLLPPLPLPLLPHLAALLKPTSNISPQCEWRDLKETAWICRDPLDNVLSLRGCCWTPDSAETRSGLLWLFMPTAPHSSVLPPHTHPSHRAGDLLFTVSLFRPVTGSAVLVNFSFLCHWVHSACDRIETPVRKCGRGGDCGS